MAKTKEELRERQNKYQRDWYKKNKTKHILGVRKAAKERAKKHHELIYNYLLDNPCVDCGEKDPLVLQFDHVRGEKKFDISYGIAARSLEKLVAEIEKCDIRCANCHQRKTAKQRKYYKFICAIDVQRQHGSLPNFS